MSQEAPIDEDMTITTGHEYIGNSRPSCLSIAEISLPADSYHQPATRDEEAIYNLHSTNRRIASNLLTVCGLHRRLQHRSKRH